jgi:hypothetical protein
MSSSWIIAEVIHGVIHTYIRYRQTQQVALQGLGMLSTFKIEVKVPKELTRFLSGADVQKAINRTLDRAVRAGRAEAIRIIQQQYNVKSTMLRGRLKVWIEPSQSRGVIEATGGRLPLKMFDPKQVITFRNQKSGGIYSRLRKAKAGRPSAGVTVQIRRGKRVPVQGGFIALQGDVFKRKAPPRLPIKSLVTVGVPGMFSSRDVMEPVKQKILETWNKNIVHELTKGFQYGKK